MRSTTRVMNSSIKAAPYNIMSRVTSRLKPSPRHSAQQLAKTRMATQGVSFFRVTLPKIFGMMPSLDMASGSRE